MNEATIFAVFAFFAFFAFKTEGPPEGGHYVGG